VSKRELLAQTMNYSGLTWLLERLPATSGILIINHHRIGEARESQFDRAVFSASTEQFDDQVVYLKQRFPVIGEAELMELVWCKRPLKRLHIVLTFDDGYIDNYTNAFEVLKSRGCPAFFFVVPDFVGTTAIPWWDAIAYMVRHSAKKTLRITVPSPLDVSLEGDREQAIVKVLRHFKRGDVRREREFLAQLEEEAAVELPQAERRFLSWEEAVEMRQAGMTIGSHTLTHCILAHLTAEQQEYELKQSRSVIAEKIGAPVLTLAYPVGSVPVPIETEQIAERAGYSICFTAFGGFNQPGGFRSTNLKRTSIAREPAIFRNQMAFVARTGRLPYS
jgi:peptidoglycan/xylan/chitin deacetylase (PgdA/CDA1 family)